MEASARRAMREQNIAEGGNELVEISRDGRSAVFYNAASIPGIKLMAEI